MKHLRNLALGMVLMGLFATTSVSTSIAVQSTETRLEPITTETAERLEFLGTVDALAARDLTFSSDSRYLINTYQLGFYRTLRNATDGRFINQFDFPQAIFSPEYLLGATDQWLVMDRGIFDLLTNERLLEFPEFMLTWVDTPDGSLLTGVQEYRLSIWRVTDDLKIEQVQTIMSDNAAFLEFSIDGTRLFGLENWLDTPFDLVQWDIATGEIVYRVTQPPEVDDVIYGGAGQAYFFRNLPDQFTLYDVESGQAAGEYVFDTSWENETGEINTSLAFDGAFTVAQRCLRIPTGENTTTCTAHEIALFDTETRHLLHTFEVGDSDYLAIPHAISPDKRLFAFLNSDSDVEVWGIPAADICRINAIQSARLRVSPDANSTQIGDLDTGESRVVLGQAVGTDGLTWWAVYGAWVRSDLTSETEGCTNAPTIEF